jgi:hypothetical protein
MDKINAMYRELLDSGEEPDTAVMNYNTYRKLITDMGGTKTFISPPGIYLSNGATLELEIDDSLKDEEILIRKR